MNSFLIKQKDSQNIIRFNSNLPLTVASWGVAKHVKWDAISLDLIEIASTILLSDRLVKSPRELFGSRHITIEIPVRNIERWDSVSTQLSTLISFLSGDDFQSSFYPKEEEVDAPDDPIADQDIQADKVVLFSGGLDSGAAAAEYFQLGPPVIYVTKYVTGISEVHHLLSDIKNAYGKQDLVHHAAFYISPRGSVTEHTKENTRRTRTFLYASLALVTARAFGIDEVCICENGPLAINIQLNRAMEPTRHTHSDFLMGMESLAESVFGKKINFQNPYELTTKGAMTRIFKKHPDLALRTNSCWYRQFSGKGSQYGKGHCGYCLPCLIRLVSLKTSKIPIPTGHFDVDIIHIASKDSITREEMKLLGNLKTLLLFSNEIDTLKDWKKFVIRFPEVIETKSSLKEYSPDEWYNLIFQMMKDFSNEVITVFSGVNL